MSRVADEPTRSFAWSTIPPDRPRVHLFWEGGSTTGLLEPGKTLLVGRADDCDLQVLHPSVSRHHAKVHGGPPVTIEDLGSSRGTRVDGQPIGKVPALLERGQIVELGGAMLVLQQPAESALPAPHRGAVAAGAPEALERFVPLVARSQLTVLIVGETGAGKEVMAERIHSTSARSGGPFVKLNCAAFPETLLESELFGHEKGAFTGAAHTKLGLIESADRGTLLLDEVGEMPPGTQAKLLRTLESREVRRVGAVQPFIIDVRFLSATNRDLQVLVKEGKFRQDLYFRLNGITIAVPPLRDQPGQILVLAREFAARAARAAQVPAPVLTKDAEAVLLQHAWPGNVRELRNVMDRAFVLSEGAVIEAVHLLLTDPPPSAPSLGDKLDAYERDQIIRALEEAKGNQTKAAAILGISRRALINRIESYKLPRPRKST